MSLNFSTVFQPLPSPAQGFECLDDHDEPAAPNAYPIDYRLLTI
jgi:hypothetical protein